ncbi:MAG: hypothetical protein M0R47_17005 [Methylobacter sp.]|uniref:hypothetical protein n=1 Tax=Methylobacter sp. TaxID=2051955 RepID=UPI0025D19974|nr:hypothetical protein [Methylobacter sp.]MCK9622223.1 hypothetical protein [Methylobacter sp.]
MNMGEVRNRFLEREAVKAGSVRLSREEALASFKREAWNKAQEFKKDMAKQSRENFKNCETALLQYAVSKDKKLTPLVSGESAREAQERRNRGDFTAQELACLQVLPPQRSFLINPLVLHGSDAGVAL